MIPKIMYPTYNITVPSTKKTYKFRPFLVREEKILFMARASEDANDTLIAIKQIISNCAMEDFDVEVLPIFDLEYVFLKIRANSVDNMVNISITDEEDEKDYDINIDLNKIEINIPEKTDFKIQINDNAGVMMKYPAGNLYGNKEINNLEENDEEASSVYYRYLAKCIDKIYMNEEVIDASTVSDQDLFDFVESLDLKSFQKIETFMESVPRLSHTAKYTNSLGNEKEIVLNTLNDFFTLR